MPLAVGYSDYGIQMGFQGLYLDDESGLIYNRARYLSPALERFMQRDPLGYPDGMNGYAAYHVMRGMVDPMGNKAVGINARTDEEKKGDKFEDVTRKSGDFTEAPNLGKILDRIQKVRDAANDMTNKQFEDLKKETGIFWRGDKFNGTREEFIKLADRELESHVIRQKHGSYSDFINKVASESVGLDQDYDIIVVAMHGLHDRTGKPLGIAGRCGDPPTHKQLNTNLGVVQAFIRDNGVKANITFLSCYNNPGQELVSYSYIQDPGESKRGQNTIHYFLRRGDDRKLVKTDEICGLSLTNVTVSVDYGEEDTQRTVPIPFIEPAPAYIWQGNNPFD